MNTLRKHLPSFADPYPSVEQVEWRFDTTADLLALPIIRRIARRRGFSHFAMHGNYLMAVLGVGDTFFTVGYISNPLDVDLPQWEE
jgi:hypothetical protein